MMVVVEGGDRRRAGRRRRKGRGRWWRARRRRRNPAPRGLLERTRVRIRQGLPARLEQLHSLGGVAAAQGVMRGLVAVVLRALGSRIVYREDLVLVDAFGLLGDAIRLEVLELALVGGVDDVRAAFVVRRRHGREASEIVRVGYVLFNGSVPGGVAKVALVLRVVSVFGILRGIDVIADVAARGAADVRSVRDGVGEGNRDHLHRVGHRVVGDGAIDNPRLLDLHPSLALVLRGDNDGARSTALRV